MPIDDVPVVRRPLRSTLLAAMVTLAVGFSVCGAYGQRPSLLTAEGFPIVKGQARLMLGLYENPADDAVLREAVEAGFDLIQCSADAKALDRVHAQGAMAWINLTGSLMANVEPKERAGRIRQVVDKFKSHPALFAWEGPDEVVWNVWYGRVGYFGGSEFPAMATAISEAGLAADKLRQLNAKVHEYWSRGLYDRFEEARREFWEAAGKKPPQPELRMDTLAQEARKTSDDLDAGLAVVKDADPSHIIWLNHAPRNWVASLAYVNRPADMAGCDIYPVPTTPRVGHSDLDNTLLSCVGDYTDRMREAAPGKACAMVLQGFGWRDLDKPEQRSKDPAVGRRPTFHETRFMAYDALVRGANAILYWGTAYANEYEPGEPVPATLPDGRRPRPRLWRDLLAVARELRALETAIVAPNVKPAPRFEMEENAYSLDGKGLRMLLKKAGDDFVLIVVNEKEVGVAFRVRGLPEALAAKALERLGNGESVTVRDGGFRDGIGPYGVYVYATSRRFEGGRK